MALFDTETWKKMESVLEGMKDEVNLLFFSQTFECRSCEDTREFLEEFTKLSNRVKVKKVIFDESIAEAEKYGVEKIPAIVMLDKDIKDTGIRYYGVPAGYEINSFIMSLLEVSGREEELDPELEERIADIKKDIHIEVFISLTCPYCPAAVITAHKLALKNPKIKADMVDATVFPHLANKYNVTGVPKIIINGKYDLTGAQSIERFLDIIEIA